jgi:hypothetical protein
MDKHTPGPWVKEPFGTTFVIRGPQRQIVCGTVEAENADLLISVPEMLDALLKWDAYDTLLRSLPGEGPLYKGQLDAVDEAYDACRDATVAALAKASTRRDGPVLQEGVAS